ncbi:MAG TPA: T9SS type A sorting domain-containing protein [Candidatus Coatesbacteria bacterium]|nr:T9SS type A sorting domain-containing protein [Candidatus Coatesbacteria bacterium]
MRAVVFLLAVFSAAAALEPFGAIRPEGPSVPEAQQAHGVNNLYLVFTDTLIDDARWPGAGGTDLLYMGYLGFGVAGGYISSYYYTDQRWRLEAGFYSDWSWPTEVPWGDVPPRYGDENILVYMTVEGEEPLGVRLRQHSFGFADGRNEDCIFILWTVYNAEAGMLKGTAAGLFMDMDIGYEGYNEFTRYDTIRHFAYMYNDPSLGEPLYFGLTTMGGLPGSYHGWSIHDSQFDHDGDLHYAMVSQVGRYQELPEYFWDWRLLLGFSVHDLAPGEMRDYPVALVAGDSLEDVYSSVRAARVKWLDIFGEVGPEDPAPARLTLSEPWPCPASSEARFFVELLEGGHVAVALYDLSGRRVETVHEGVLAAGRSELSVWTGGLPSGVYLVRAAGENGAATRRLVVAR